MTDERCCPGHGTMAHVRGCVNHPEYRTPPNPVEGKVVDTGPICHLHGETPSMHGFRQSWPAHTMGLPEGGECQNCPEPVRQGDRYVCHADASGSHDGIAHVACPRPTTEGASDEGATACERCLRIGCRGGCGRPTTEGASE